jgi:hypothetical protein
MIKVFTKLFCLGMLLAGCAAHNPPKPPINPDFLVTVNFNFDFTNFSPCSGTVTTGCINGFKWGYLSGSNQVVLKTSAPSICTGSTQPEACTDSTNTKLPMGSLTFYALATFVDNTGAAGVSDPGVTAVPSVVTAPNPTGVTVTIK